MPVEEKPVWDGGEIRRSVPSENERPIFSSRILDGGFLFALGLSAVCFLFSATYLYRYLTSTDAAVNSLIHDAAINPAVLQIAVSAKLAVAKYSLLSCGVVAGLAFGFLGFALFLLGVRGNMEVKANHAATGIQLAQIAPGTFVILCSTVLIGLSVTHSLDFTVSGQYAQAQERTTRNSPYSAPEVGHDRKP